MQWQFSSGRFWADEQPFGLALHISAYLVPTRIGRPAQGTWCMKAGNVVFNSRCNKSRHRVPTTRSCFNRDCAIGVGQVHGFKLIENLNREHID